MFSGPGGGKSRFLDEFSSLFGHPDQLERLVGPQTTDNAVVYECINGLVPIAITYSRSSPSPYQEEYDARDAVRGFVLRVLMGYVVFHTSKLMI